MSLAEAEGLPSALLILTLEYDVVGVLLPAKHGIVS